MLDDKDLIPLCKRVARRFIKQASHLGSCDDVFNELVNEAYVAGKPRNSLGNAYKWMIYKLIHYTTVPSVAKSKEHPSKAFRICDLRKRKDDLEKPAEEIVEEHEIGEKVKLMIEHLSIADFTMLLLRFGCNKKYKDIGAVFGCSSWWASQRIREVLNRMRTELEK